MKKIMNKNEFLKPAAAKYVEITALKEIHIFLDYERCFAEIWTELEASSYRLNWESRVKNVVKKHPREAPTGQNE
jgi:hypothetical protein